MVFKREESGPRWRGTFAAFAEAERLARESARAEGIEFFVFSFKEYRVIARFFPTGISEQPEPPGFGGFWG